MKMRTKGLAAGAMGLLMLAGAAMADYNNPLSYSSLGNLNIGAGTYLIDTDTLEIWDLTGAPTVLFTGQASGSIAVFTFASVNIGSGAVVSGTGTRAISLLSQSSLTVDGTIFLGGGAGLGSGGAFPLTPPAGGFGGPGGFDGGRGEYLEDDGMNTITHPAHTGQGPGGGGAGTQPFDFFDNPGGGGGAGHGGFGGDGGGNASESGDGGTSYGNLQSSLVGGSGGGGGAYAFFSGAGGGAGGGAIELAAINSVDITGLIDASGGAGGSSYDYSGAGGGGSGGGILIHGQFIDVSLGLLNVTGGNGGGVGDDINGTAINGGGGAGGRIFIDFLSDNGSFTGSAANFLLSGGLGGEEAGDGELGVVVIVPEPATLSAMLVGGLALLRRRRA